MSRREAGGRRGFWVFSRTARAFAALNGPFLSAGLAFYVLLYCFPLLLLFATGLGTAMEESYRATHELEALVGRLFPGSEQAVIEAIESFGEHRSILGLLTVLSFLLFGTFLFGSVRHVLNVVFGVEQRRTFLRALGTDIVAMLGTGGLFAVTVGIASSAALAVEVASRLGTFGHWLEPGWAFVGRLLTFLFAVALLYLLFRIAPARKISRGSLIEASVAGALLLEISKWFFAAYVRAAQEYTVLYGALGGLIFFVLWIYYASLVFVLAATLARVLDRS